MKHGFSLVELSIVLVILGLLTGGILAGQNLIRASELRSVTTEYERYTAAVNTFRDKYFAIPGDMANATSFWGDQASGTGACADGSIPDGSPGTCNGNGDGIIGPSTELFRFWQHLANAGLIEGSYTGIAGPLNSAWDTDIGVNAPRSKLGNAGWTVLSIVYDIGFGDVSAINGDQPSNWQYTTNQFHFGTEHATQWTQLPAIAAEEAWNIDTKMDDGHPGRGGVYALQRNQCTDASNNDVSNANYDLDNTGIHCGLIFVPGF